MARAPEVIILAAVHGAGDAGRSSPREVGAPAELPAIRAGRLHSVDGDSCTATGRACWTGSRCWRASSTPRRSGERGRGGSRLALGVAGRCVAARGRRARALPGQRRRLAPRAVLAALAGRAGAGVGRGGGDAELRLPRIARRRARRRRARGGGRRASRRSRAIRWPSPRCSACRAARPSAWCSAQLFGLGAAAPARRSASPPSPSRARCWRRGAVYLIAAVRGRPVHPDPAAGRRDRRHLLLLGHHRADLARGHQPAGRRRPLAARQLAPDPARRARRSSPSWPLAGFWPDPAARARAQPARPGRGGGEQLGVDAARLKRRVFAGGRAADRQRGGLRGADRLRGLDRAPRAARMLLGPDNRLLVPDRAAGRRRSSCSPPTRWRATSWPRPSCRWASSRRSAARRSSSTCCARGTGPACDAPLVEFATWPSPIRRRSGDARAASA